MRVIIKSKGGDLEPNVRDYAMEKFLKFEKLIEEPAVCEVMLCDAFGPKGGVDKYVKVAMTEAHEKNPMHVEAKATEFLAAIDIATDCLETQLVKHKELKKIGNRNVDIQ
jgi:ribosomal subunit interface protein